MKERSKETKPEKHQHYQSLKNTKKTALISSATPCLTYESNLHKSLELSTMLYSMHTCIHIDSRIEKCGK